LLTSPPLSLIQTFTSIDDAIRANSAFVETILTTGCVAFGVDPSVLPDQLSLLPAALRGEVENAVDKVTSVLKQFVRDWSEEGKEERAPGYGRVLHALAKRWGVNERAGKRVLVPGAGLGRLALEVAEMGFRAEGNEWSYAMLVGSQFVLNWYVLLRC
jgi:carnosine N-methyltransferase